MKKNVNFRPRNKSAKTSWYGKAVIIMGAIGSLLLLFDGDPSTMPDINDITEALALLGITIPTWLGFLASRDNTVTSEEVGLKDDTTKHA